MRDILFRLIASITFTSCQLTQQKTDSLAILTTNDRVQMVFAETSSVLSQFTSMNVFLNGEYIGNTIHFPVIINPVTQMDNHLVSQGLLATSYADFVRSIVLNV